MKIKITQTTTAKKSNKIVNANDQKVISIILKQETKSQTIFL